MEKNILLAALIITEDDERAIHHKMHDYCDENGCIKEERAAELATALESRKQEILSTKENKS